MQPLKAANNEENDVIAKTGNETLTNPDYDGMPGTLLPPNDTNIAFQLFLFFFTFGFIAMFVFMNKLRYIERELDVRLERSFGDYALSPEPGNYEDVSAIQSGDNSSTNHMRRNHSVNSSNSNRSAATATHTDAFLPMAVAIPGGWELGRSTFQQAMMIEWQRQHLFQRRAQLLANSNNNQGSHRHEERGVTEAARQRWTRFQVQPTNSKENDPLVSGVSSEEESIAADTENQGGSNVTTNGISTPDRQGTQLISYGSCIPINTNTGTNTSSPVNTEEGTICSICLCEYKPQDKAVLLPCQHVFHEDCVSLWTSNHVRCPLCNFDLNDDNLEEV